MQITQVRDGFPAVDAALSLLLGPSVKKTVMFFFPITDPKSVEPVAWPIGEQCLGFFPFWVPAINGIRRQ